MLSIRRKITKLFLLLELIFIVLFINESSSHSLYTVEEESERDSYMAGVLNNTMFEGFDDIVIAEEQSTEVPDETTNDDRFNDGGTGLRNEKYRWPKTYNFIEVPYTIDAASSYTHYQKSNIIAAMDEIHSKTCIRFVERTNQENYITFRSDKRICCSFLGMRGGQQFIDVHSSGCAESKGIVIHEILHALGFHHMQAHTDRNDFVEIFWSNIEGSYSNYNYQALSEYVASNFGTPYDFFSIMHYPAFLHNGDRAIKPKPEYMEYDRVMGQRAKLSEGDIKRINSMYDCDVDSITLNRIILMCYKNGAAKSDECKSINPTLKRMILKTLLKQAEKFYFKKVKS